MRRRTVVFGALGLALLLLSVLAPAPVGSLQRRALGRWWRSAQRGWLIATGRLVDVGGYRLRVDCYGQGHVTVVLESGLCQTRASWAQVVDDVAPFARVCAYDRAGLGESDRAPDQRTLRGAVEDLERVLVAVRAEAPYVLVGHSIGGLTVRLYAAQHPERVGGVVLVDASHETQSNRLSELMNARDRADFLQHQGGGNCEGLDLLAAPREVHRAGSLPAVPLIVLTARTRWVIAGSPDNALRAELQARLAQLSPRAEHVIVERSGHFIQVEHPDVVTAAIRKVAGAVATSGRADSGGPR